MEVVHRGTSRVLIGSGLEEEEHVVVSQLGQPREGMLLRSRIADRERPAGEHEEPRS